MSVELDDGTDTIHFNLPKGNGIAPSYQSVGVRVVSKRGETEWRDVQVGQWSTRIARNAAFAAGKITAVDYTEDRIAVTIDGPGASAFTPDAHIRIFNDSRSAMYRITAVNRTGGRLWLTLDATALLAQGKVIRVEDSRLFLNASLNFADGEDVYNRFAGAWLGDEHDAVPVKAATRQEATSVVYLRDAIPAARLEKRYVNTLQRIWQFGVGDQVEIAKISAIKPAH
jgi:hypothetical protein